MRIDRPDKIGRKENHNYRFLDEDQTDGVDPKSFELQRRRADKPF
jgi:hypothetical protein